MSDPHALLQPQPGSASEADLLALRDRFPILSTSTYLISNSLGAMPRRVGEALAGYAESWATLGVRAWETEWWMLSQRVGNAIGQVIGAAPETVSTHQNVTVASAVAASCFDFDGDRCKVVCSDLNFPSLVHLYRGMERRGAELCLVPSEDGFTVPAEALLEAIDERTALVPISHVIFRSAFVQDAKAIVARAHAVGARVVLDVYQSAGIMPLDVAALDVDFAVGGVLKWLCGGPGVAFLYANPARTADLRPALTGWFARADPFAFDANDTSYGDGAWAYQNGTTAIPSLTAALPGVELLAELDMAAVRSKSLRQTERLIGAAQAQGWMVRTPSQAARRGGHVVIDMPGSEAITRRLLEDRVMVDHRPGAGIRVAPHFYTTDDEIDRALEAMRTAATGS